MDQVRFGVVGLGGMGNFHLSYLNSVDGATVAAVCDVNPGKVEAAAAKWYAAAR